MSSHHVVRDHQEATILLLHPPVKFETLGELLEWGGALWGEPETLPWLVSHRIKPDCILSHLSDEQIGTYFPDVTVLRCEMELSSRIQLIADKTGNPRVMIVSSDCVARIQTLIKIKFFPQEVFFVDDVFRYFFCRGEKLLQIQKNGSQTDVSLMEQPFFWQSLRHVFSVDQTAMYLVRILWQ
jgi:hypothetical protein